MNSKKAKALRKIAHFTAIQQGLNPDVRELIENEGRRKYQFEVIRDHEGNVVTDSETGRPRYNAKFIAFGQMTNSPDTVRGKYRALKRLHKISVIGK